MKMIKKCSNAVKYGASSVLLSLIGKSAFATDLMGHVLEGDVQDSLGSHAKFWTIFTLVAIVLATGSAVATKNPMVFAGVMVVAFIPGALINIFVF